MKSSCVPRTAWLFGVSCTLLFGLSASAAEEARFPQRFISEVAERPLRAYIKSSQEALSNLDKLAQDTSAATPEAPKWKPLATKQLASLRDAEKRALWFHSQQTKKTLLPAAIRSWILNEKLAWTRIESIGGQLIEMHDEVLKTNADIKTETPLLEKEREAILAWARQTEKGIGAVADKAIGGPIADVAGVINEIIEIDQRISPLANLYMLKTLRLKEHIVTFDKKLKAANYEANVSKVFSEPIAPATTGVFYKHEKLWEASLSSALKTYKANYVSYEVLAKPVITETFLQWSPYFGKTIRGMPASLKKFMTDLQEKARKRQLTAKPEAKISRVEFPTSLAPGKAVAIEALIENNGNRPFAAGELELVCTIEKSPDPKVRSGTLVFKEVNAKSIALGETLSLGHQWEVPAFTGSWSCEWELKYNTTSLDKHLNSFTVSGTQSVKIESVKIPKPVKIGRDVEVEIAVKNTGQATIGTGDLVVICGYKSAPSGIRPNRLDFAFATKLSASLEPGKTTKLEKRVKVPTGAGPWELEFRVQIGNRVADKQTVEVKVEP